MPFPFFPYCDFHALNADWILKKMRQMCAFIKSKSEEVDTAVESIEGYNARLTDAEDNIRTLQNSAVSYAAEQQLTPEQKTRARGNISAAPAIGVVYYNAEQLLSDEYKATARDNIGAASAADLSDVNGDVQVLEGRVNGLDETAPYIIVLTYSGNDYHLTATPEQVYNAVEDGQPVVLSIPSLSDFPNAPSGVQVAELTQAVAGVNNGILETRFTGTVSVGTALSVELVVTIADNDGATIISLTAVSTNHLPAPSLANAGKVPTVNNAGTGYTLQSAGGSEPPIELTFNIITQRWTGDTWANVVAAFTAGRPVRLDSAYIVMLNTNTGKAYSAMFTSGSQIGQFVINSDGTGNLVSFTMS